MRCEEAQELFHSYLDDDLTPSLETELAAHRVQCADCRRALALLEVSGHVIRSQPDSATISSDFADRLLACVESGRRPWPMRIRWAVYMGGPLAAAALVALAVLGVFDRPKLVAGHKQVTPAVEATAPSGRTQTDEIVQEAPAEDDHLEQVLAEFLRKTQENVREKQQGVQSFNESLDLTILQWLDILEERRRAMQNDATSTTTPASLAPSDSSERPNPSDSEP